MKEQEEVPCSKGVFVHYIPPNTGPETSCSLLSPADVCALVQESLKKGGQYTNDALAATHIVVHHEHETRGDVSAVVCSPLWLFASAQAGEWVDPADHPMYRPFGSLSLKGAAAFGMGTITQTGFIGWRRKLVPTLLYCANLSYCRHLIHSDTPQKTCIVIAEDVNATAAKIIAAKSSNIPVVNLKWLLESLEQWIIQPPQEYSENDPDISLVLKSTNEIKSDTVGMVCDSEDSDGDSSGEGKVVHGGDDEVKVDTNNHKMEGEGKRRRVSVLKKESKPREEVCEVTAHVALTSMHADQQKRILERAKERKNIGMIVHPSDENDHGWSSEYSHLVAPQALTRTQKCLAALAAGIWIVGPKFIDEYGNESKQEESVEERHEVMFAGSSTVEHGVARHWRLRRQTTGHGAFYGLKFAIANVLKDGDAGKRPDRDDLVAIIAAGQGEVVRMSSSMEAVDVVIAPSTTKRPSALLKHCIDHGAVCVAPRYVVDWLAMPHTSLDEHVLLSSRRSDAVRALEDGRASLRSRRPTGSSTSVSL